MIVVYFNHFQISISSISIDLFLINPKVSKIEIKCKQDINYMG
jgi:hypothetical protein